MFSLGTLILGAMLDPLLALLVGTSLEIFNPGPSLEAFNF